MMRTISNVRPVLVAVALAGGVVAPGALAEPKAYSRQGDWTVYTAETNGDRICYALSAPTDQAPTSVDHGKVYVMISTWRSGAAKEQPSFIAGYELKANSPTRARVRSDRFNLFVDGSEAFLEAKADEARLVKAMQKGSSLRIEAVSARGTATAYEFSLKGVTAATRDAVAACQ